MSRIKRRTAHNASEGEGELKEEEGGQTGNDEGEKKKKRQNNHDLHRNAKAAPPSFEEMTRRCFW